MIIPIDDPAMWYAQEDNTPTTAPVIIPLAASGGGGNSSAAKNPEKDVVIPEQGDDKPASAIATSTKQCSEALLSPSETPVLDGPALSTEKSSAHEEEHVVVTNIPEPSEASVSHPSSVGHKDPFPHPMVTRFKRRIVNEAILKFTKRAKALVNRIVI